MKSIWLRVILMGTLGLCLSIHGLGLENPQIAAEKKPLVKKLFADLTAKVEIKFIKYPSGYILRPRYVVSNQGTAVARRFKVVLYHLYRSGPKGRVSSTYWCSNRITLGVNQSWTFDYNPINDASWNSQKGGQVGFRVVADHDTQIWESNENNNVAIKWWPVRLKGLKRKLIKKR